MGKKEKKLGKMIISIIEPRGKERAHIDPVGQESHPGGQAFR